MFLSFPSDGYLEARLALRRVHQGNYCYCWNKVKDGSAICEGVCSLDPQSHQVVKLSANLNDSLEVVKKVSTEIKLNDARAGLPYDIICLFGRVNAESINNDDSQSMQLSLLLLNFLEADFLCNLTRNDMLYSWHVRVRWSILLTNSFQEALWRVRNGRRSHEGTTGGRAIEAWEDGVSLCVRWC